jgi:transcription elongation factor Elf1
MDRKIFKCQGCNAIVAEETGKLVLGSKLYEQVRSVQGHVNGERADCKECGKCFTFDIMFGNHWEEE